MGKKSRRVQRQKPAKTQAAAPAPASMPPDAKPPSNLKMPEQFSMSQVAGDMQAAMQKMIELGGPSSPAYKEGMKPISVTRAVEKEIKALPKTDQVWIVNVEKDEMLEDKETSPSLGYMCFAQGTVTIVTKEGGGNGKPHIPNQSLTRCGDDDISDALSFSLAVCADEFHDSYNINPLQESEICRGTIAKACLSPGQMLGGMGIPGGASFQPARPTKILFTKEGTMNLLRVPLLEMGIKQVGLASKKLIQSIRTSFTEKSENDDRRQAALMAAMSDPNNPEHLANIILASNESAYVPETRTPLGSWRPEPEVLEAYPLSFWVRPPEYGTSYRHTMLFGWRTNLELACERCDTEKVRQILEKHSVKSARDFAERRLLLDKAATKGLLTTCKMLVEWLKVGVDGVQSPDNKPEWHKAQEGSGNNNDAVGYTPLINAVKEGNTGVAKYLISKGATVNITHLTFTQASPLHFAVLNGHLDCVKLLVRNGANIDIRDSTGCTPAMLATACFEGIVGHNQHNDAHQKIVSFFGNPDGNVNACSACGTIPARPRTCPCGIDIYCDATCQRKRWKLHKEAHTELMDTLVLWTP